MRKLRTRLAFDAVLTALLAFEMFFEMTGDTLHEIIGVVFFATIIAHLVLSRKWIGATAKAVSAGKRMKPMATARMVMGILLSISMVALMASSVAISNLLAGAGLDLAGAAYGTWSLVHTVSAYALCCLVVAHLGIHWASIASAFRISYNPERRAAISTGVTALGALGVTAIGLAGYNSVAAPASLAVAETASASQSDEHAQISNASPEEPADESSNPVASGKNMKHGRKHGAKPTEGGEGRSAQKPSFDLDATDGSSANSDTDSYDSSGSDDNRSPSNNPYVESGSDSTSISGTCTLCRKNCPLSAPKCNKPYEAGLL